MRKLKKNELGIIADERGVVEIHVPKTDPVPEHIVMWTSIVILIKNQDEDFRQYLLDKFEELTAEAKKPRLVK